MSKADLPDLIRARFDAGESVLWKHIPEQLPTMQSQYEGKRFPLWVDILIYGGLTAMMFNQYQKSPDTFFQDGRTYIIIGVAFFAMSWMFKVSGLSERFQGVIQPYSIFKGLIITNKNVIVFNSPDAARFIPRGTITALKQDFENGAHALSIKAKTAAKRIVIVGNADFTAAEYIFKKNT